MDFIQDLGTSFSNWAQKAVDTAHTAIDTARKNEPSAKKAEEKPGSGFSMGSPSSNLSEKVLKPKSKVPEETESEKAQGKIIYKKKVALDDEGKPSPMGGNIGEDFYSQKKSEKVAVYFNTPKEAAAKVKATVDQFVAAHPDWTTQEVLDFNEAMGARDVKSLYHSGKFIDPAVNSGAQTMYLPGQDGMKKKGAA
jgi:hypothetical protein